MEYYAKLFKKEGEERFENHAEEKDNEGEGDSVFYGLDDDFSYKEVWSGIKKLGNNKAPGEDGITAEFLKNLPNDIMEKIREVMNELWNGEELAEGWRRAKIVPIHKGGEEVDKSNYRGISLLDVGYKLLTILMTERQQTRG